MTDLEAKDFEILTARRRLLRDGQEIASGNAQHVVPAEVDPPPGRGLGHFAIAGELALPSTLEPCADSGG